MAASMAASMMRPRMISFCQKHMSSVHGFKTVLIPACRQSTLVVQQVPEVVEYPPVKPKYPPGRWSKDMPPKQAWKIHDEGQELLQIPTIKGRLEKLAGPWDRPTKPHYYNVNMYNNAPGLCHLKQYLTKTHIAPNMPSVYDDLDTGNDLAKAFDRLRPLLLEAVQEEHDQYIYCVERPPNDIHLMPDERATRAHNLVGRLLNLAMSGLSSERPYLLRSQLDENVRIQTFWRRIGDNYEKAHGRVGLPTNCLNFETRNIANYQVRTEMPLPEFLPLEDKLCQEGEVPHVRYTPMFGGTRISRERPMTVSGHWIGDPCEFGHLSVNIIGKMYDRHDGYKHDYIDEETLAWGAVGGFGLTVAQAYNQGFNFYFDVTYPFTSQMIITDGQWFRFFAYQLNTIHLWKDDEANPLRNIMWASPRFSLFDVIEDGKVKGLNEEVLKYLVKFILLEPQDRGVNLRPYLPEEESPAVKDRYINDKGTEHLPYHKIGRYEYPRNAVYY